ncbi:MAG: hypothetical protein A2Z91_09495 [Deltaproteobacteria bacterium GWA2_38_16]|nr:MAG: hypothetical protein A2Z91_09495 [Deltaproteobacteria bacterium GWA2_38_16]OGQ02472.1 MAG: hypothetical protein A3D19_09235 [Deltaproteobacteria bacterium RIFCSPHIGHO2_02_FULL_38_15]OGQ34420.1 MAG: hypothetical protein A3A72_06050 [Deltaproteobacteria bacterium RIFCSPLOWO2_01_FULL_38_9]HBQ21074.1 acyl-CoA thioesterase [Deltaproteobacteria bacterium]
MITYMKTVKESAVEMTEIVMPQDTNTLGTIFGGKVMQWMDIAAAICGFRHCRTAVVTASVDTLSFHYAIKTGNIVSIKASVNYTANTSMEIGVCVYAEDPLSGEKKHASSAYFTFVAVDGKGRPIAVPKVIPETKDEKRRYREAQERRKIRLQMRKKST